MVRYRTTCDLSVPVRTLRVHDDGETRTFEDMIVPAGSDLDVDHIIWLEHGDDGWLAGWLEQQIEEGLLLEVRED